MVEKETLGEKIFNAINILLMIFMVIITFYPFYYCVICSISDGTKLIGASGAMLLPKGFSLSAYTSVLSNPNIRSGYSITIFVLIFGTLINLIATTLGAFLLTRREFAIRKFLTYMMLFTMYFSGGMIPTYLVVTKILGLGNSLWALILPSAISVYNLIVMRTNFESIPISLEEAAKIDGANDFRILINVILPLSKSIIAVMIMFYGVAHWNAWFNAAIYITDRNKYPLQLILREILLLNTARLETADVGDRFAVGESIKYANIVVSTLPILCVYPFIQKYFVKGIMIGAVKG